MSFSNISQKDYLKKYLSSEDVKKTKKKKISSNKVKRSKIIDDDIDLKNMRALDDDEIELFQMDEDAPQIAGIVDERPPDVIAQEQYNSKRWKVFGGEDGVSVVDNMNKNQENVSDKLSKMFKEYDEVDNSGKNSGLIRDKVSVKTGEETRIEITDKSRTHDSDSDNSPVRTLKSHSYLSKKSSSDRKKHVDSDSRTSHQGFKKPKLQQVEDFDLSPPRNDRKNSVKKKYDSDTSPPRRDTSKKSNRNSSDSDPSPPRKGDGSKQLNRNLSDSDASPPRKGDGRKLSSHSSRYTPKRDQKQQRIGSDYKRTQKYNSDSDSDTSPPRKTDKRYKNKYDIKSIPLNKTRRKSSSESDRSLSRNDKKNSSSPQNDARKRSSRSDISPVRSAFYDKSFQPNRTKTNNSPRLSRRDLMDEKNVRRHFSDSDDSPPRRRRTNSFRNDNSVPDLSPPRKRSSVKEKNPPKKALYKPNDSSSSEESSRSKSKKMKTTLDGKQAGLQDAKQLRKELSDLKMKEDVMFSKMDASVSGVGAAPIKRDRKTGEVRDLEKEKEAQKEKEAKESVINEKYYKWGKGLKQVEDAAVRAADTLKEMSKPLARYVNDTDLDNYLKAQEREGDPMLDYIKRKQSEATPLAGVKPIYQGSFNPNRFRIRPGHRWDGVVRSNGYEQEWFTHQNARKATADEAYKWSTSDM
uniref:BUD13 homolog n=2 Tax=Graphocephala atropunctata TaxID=36148 RepID=A0A1B6KCJ8_9HEMI